MNVLERMKINDTERKIADFKVKQHQDYDFKVAYAETRVWEFVRECGKRDFNTHISVGGLDSITLCYFIKSLGLDIPMVSASSLEDKSIQAVHKQLGVINVKPIKNKVEVIKEFGYPILSKEIANKISLLQRASEDNKTVRHAIITGETGEYGGNRKDTRMKLSQQWLELFGGYENENEGVDYLKPDFLVSDRCCYYLKEKPCDDWAKQNNSVPFLGLMASEGGRRQKSLMMNGCNYFGETTVRSAPFAIFYRQDLLQLALDLNVPIPEIYGEIKKDSEGKLYTTKAQRTGCSMCGFGIQKERTRPHRFDLLYQRNPKEWAYWMENVGFGKCFDWIGFNWRQPFIPGEPAWIPQETMKNIIDARKGNQLSFFEQ
ncbi:MAG: hypothetical protein K5979_09225 [Ruminococcus sp.]|nr:hypothetical protein [Ruminococcus sp.]